MLASRPNNRIERRRENIKLLERIGLQDPKIHFEGRAIINRVELIRRTDSGLHRSRLNEEITFEGVDDQRDGSRFELNHKIGSCVVLGMPRHCWPLTR